MRSSQCQETTSRKDTCHSASPHPPPLSRSTSTNRQQKHHDATCRCSLAAADQRRARIGFCRERARRRRRRSRASSAKESGDDAEGSGAHGFLLVSLFLASSFSASFFFSAFFFPLRRDAGRAPPPRPARAPGPKLGLRARVPADGPWISIVLLKPSICNSLFLRARSSLGCQVLLVVLRCLDLVGSDMQEKHVLGKCSRGASIIIQCSVGG